MFKDELGKFMICKLEKEYYAPIVAGKTVYVSHGGNCIKLQTNAMGMLVVEKPEEFQACHEEVDTLIYYHALREGGNIIVSSSDTDVLVILTSVVPKLPAESQILMDFGAGNNRRYINVTAIS